MISSMDSFRYRTSGLIEYRIRAFSAAFTLPLCPVLTTPQGLSIFSCPSFRMLTIYFEALNAGLRGCDLHRMKCRND
jgi:hypothetical protein